MSKKLLFQWFKLLYICIFLMILLGGITRLTRSGLSIVEWQPIRGVLPPSTEMQWQLEMNKYLQSPEGRLVNSQISLSDYKNIYYWEYFHRLLGRIIFVLALIPAVFFWQKKNLPLRTVVILPLFIVLQGVIGWLMVKSGLNTRPSVSHYLLAIHYFAALILIFIIAWEEESLALQGTHFLKQKNNYAVLFLFLLLLLQIFYGCLVSGLKAGFLFNDYPLMNGHWFAPNAFVFSPIWNNFFANHSLVQWIHRWLGTLFVIFHILFYYFKVLRSSDYKLRKKFMNLNVLIVLQLLLGILTLINQVPIYLAATHQLVAAMLAFSYFKILLHRKDQI